MDTTGLGLLPYFILTNEVFDRCKTRTGGPMPLVDSMRLDTFSDNHPHGSQPPVHEVLLQRAKALEAKDRLLLELTFSSNMSVREIGRILERPPGTVSRRLHRL